MPDISARERGDQWSLRRPLIGMFVLATVVAGGWLLREPALRGAANLWIVSDPISRADAIVVLGGGLETRPFIAAQMWRRGLADKILISQSPEKRAVAIGVMPSHSELMAYHSFGGEVEASSTPTIRRLTPSCRHQLSPSAYMRAKRSPPPTRWTRNAALA